MNMSSGYLSSGAQIQLVNNDAIPLIDKFDPNKIFVVDKDKKITQQEFLNDVYRLAARLPATTYILNVCENRYYFLVAFAAIIVNNSINLLPPNRQPHLLTELAKSYANCHCVLDSDIDCNIPCLNLAAVDFSTRESISSPAVLPAISAQQIAAIAFTSGSTGTPTANTKCWGTLAATSRLLAERFFSAQGVPTIVATVPSQHMYGLEMTVMMALQGGAILNAAKPFYPADIKTTLAESSAPVVLVSAPVHLRAAVNAELEMPEIFAIVSATAPLDKTLALAAENIFHAQLFEIYGCTEAGSMATRASTHTDTWRLLEGFSLTQEKERFFAHAPHLGEIAPIQDLLQLQTDSLFLLLGRNADMINVAGKRASLANLSLELLKVEGVNDGVIFLSPMVPNPSTHHEQRPVGLVVSDLSEKEILMRLAQRIDATFLPRPLRKVSSLPRNETGKLTQAALQTLWNKLHDQ